MKLASDGGNLAATRAPFRWGDSPCREEFFQWSWRDMFDQCVLDGLFPAFSVRSEAANYTLYGTSGGAFVAPWPIHFVQSDA